MLEQYFPTVLRVRSWRSTPWWFSDSWESYQKSLIRLLALTHLQRLDIVPLLTHFAEEHRGAYRRRLRRLVRRMASGMSLVDALEQTPELLSEDTVLAIRFGSQSGTLSETYQDLLDVINRPETSATQVKQQAFFYAAFMAIFLSMIFIYISINIAPKIKSIQDEMEFTHRFSVLAKLFAATQVLEQYWYVWFIALPLAISLIVSSGLRRGVQRLLPLNLTRSRELSLRAELLQMLARVVGAGRPLPGALSTLARYHFNKTLRLKLLFARNEVEQGSDIWMSLTAADLLTPAESSALQKSYSTSTRAWTMRRLAEAKSETSDRRSSAALAWLRPLLIVLFACVVLFVCFAFFEFLRDLVLQLAQRSTAPHG